MNIFKRLVRIGTAEIHSVVDKMEDPIVMTEQGIREMKDDLNKAIEAMAQIKAMAIRAKNEKNKKEESAKDYQNKAILLLTKAQKGELEMDQAEKLAREALTLKDTLVAEADNLANQQATHENAAAELNKNIEVLQFNISKWENELKTLKSRVKVSKTTKEVNKQMAQIDSNSTISMLERMRDKVEDEEALAQAYGDIAKKPKSLDDEINKALGTDNQKVNDELEEIKKNLGI